MVFDKILQGCIFLCAITCVIDKRICRILYSCVDFCWFSLFCCYIIPILFSISEKDHYFNSINVQYLLLFVVSYVAIYNVDLLTNINDTIFYLATLSGYEMYTEDVLLSICGYYENRCKYVCFYFIGSDYCIIL